MIRRILGLCARERGHELQYAELESCLSEFGTTSQHYQALVYEAEREGIAPLLNSHLTKIGVRLPDSENRLLKGLCLRSNRANDIRNGAIAEILQLFEQKGLPVMLVKGIALSNFVYGTPGLRPMRDIDLLLPKEELEAASHILLEQGYTPDTDHDIPPDYYHLPPLTKTTGGLPVSIELHHNLLPLDGHYPSWPYGKSAESALTFDIDGTSAITLGLEETLWYVYLHGFRAPLTYEAFRLVHVADMVNLVERFLDRIDWDRASQLFPALPVVLSRLHFITPWTMDVTSRLGLVVDDRPQHSGVPYNGWPHRSFKGVEKTKWLELARDTLWPPSWWLQLYYGCLGGGDCIKSRIVDHPRTIWRWIKAFRHANRGLKNSNSIDH